MDNDLMDFLLLNYATNSDFLNKSFIDEDNDLKEIDDIEREWDEDEDNEYDDENDEGWDEY